MFVLQYFLIWKKQSRGGEGADKTSVVHLLLCAILHTCLTRGFVGEGEGGVITWTNVVKEEDICLFSFKIKFAEMQKYDLLKLQHQDRGSK